MVLRSMKRREGYQSTEIMSKSIRPGECPEGELAMPIVIVSITIRG